MEAVTDSHHNRLRETIGRFHSRWVGGCYTDASPLALTKTPLTRKSASSSGDCAIEKDRRSELVCKRFVLKTNPDLDFAGLSFRLFETTVQREVLDGGTGA